MIGTLIEINNPNYFAYNERQKTDGQEKESEFFKLRVLDKVIEAHEYDLFHGQSHSQKIELITQHKYLCTYEEDYGYLRSKGDVVLISPRMITKVYKP
jgi:hypothetical protein